MSQDLLFVVSKLLGPLLNPQVALYWAFVAGTLGLFTPWARAARRILLAVLGLGLILGGSPIGDWMIHRLEERFPPPVPMPDQVDGIVVLGGDANNALLRLRPVSPGGAPARQIAFADLARRWPEAKLVFSGGSGALDRPEETDAGGARLLLPLLGLDLSRVNFEDGSRNTHENAVYSLALAAPRPRETWLLVTSARHMPRAMGSFRKAGWDIVPYPVGYFTPPNMEFGWTFTNNVGRLSMALSEFAGLVYYYLLGRTDALFPAP
jgi:uncharacterized SAM-binding protein YcdF (DUF218 family)